MKMYLIMKCCPLNDQYECDTYRTPIAIVEDWEAWAQEHDPNYPFEVWAYENELFECIKTFDECSEEGMALYYWEANEDSYHDPHIIYKYPNLTRYDTVPQEVSDFFRASANFDPEDADWLASGGFISGVGDNGKWCVYGEYCDHQFSPGY